MTRAVSRGSLLQRRIVVGGVVLILAFAASSAFDVWRSYGESLAAVNRELGLDAARVNVHGGAVALGHPVGASGARVLTTLLYAMRSRGARRGVASLCLAGGEAVAMVVESI